MIDPRIELRARIAKRIKNIFYLQKKWNSELAILIAKETSNFLKFTKSYYPDKNELEFLTILNNYDDKSFIDAFELL